MGESTKIIATSIIALGIAAAGYFSGGRYTAISTSGNSVMRLDRFTGEVRMCIAGRGCDWVLDDPPTRRGASDQ